jgi:hypothetical protein
MKSTQLCRTADGNCGQGDEQTSTPSFAPDFRNSGLRTRRRPFGLLRPSLLFSGHSGAALDLSSTPEAIAGDPISSRPSPACSFSSCESCSRFHRDARSVDLLNHRAMWTRTYWRLSRAAGPLVHTAVIRLAPHRFQAVASRPTDSRPAHLAWTSLLTHRPARSCAFFIKRINATLHTEPYTYHALRCRHPDHPPSSLGTSEPERAWSALTRPPSLAALFALQLPVQRLPQPSWSAQPRCRRERESSRA